ncbi:MAG TPA: RNA polymerase sigma-70 factor [Bacteroidales bacterium]
MDISEEAIIRELKAGNEREFEQVFKKYYPMLYYEARGYTGSYDLAEDIVCDVFTRIWQNRERLFVNTSLREYLIKSVHNSAIDYYRHKKAQDKLKSGVEETHQAFTLEDLGETPLDYILTLELEDRIKRAIDKLPEQYKRTFLLSRLNDLTYEEIAKEMGISVNSVKTNIKNALAKLREQLKDFFIIIFIFIFRMFV